MSWACERRERYTVDEAMALIKRHRLMAGLAVDAARQCATLAGSDAWEIRDDDGEFVAAVFTRRGSDPWVAGIDIIPATKHFRVKDQYHDEIKSAMAPLIASLAEDGVGRVWAHIPESRARTMKAVKAAGFKFEGRMRKAVQLGRARSREDIFIYALLINGSGHDQEVDE
jgi:hypothetical protein